MLSSQKALVGSELGHDSAFGMQPIGAPPSPPEPSPPEPPSPLEPPSPELPPVFELPPFPELPPEPAPPLVLPPAPLPPPEPPFELPLVPPLVEPPFELPPAPPFSAGDEPSSSSPSQPNTNNETKRQATPARARRPRDALVMFSIARVLPPSPATRRV